MAPLEGINHELGPWLRMTSSRGAELSVDQGDRLSFEPRVPGTTRLHRVVVAAIFRHRHRRLRRHLAGVR